MFHLHPTWVGSSGDLSESELEVGLDKGTRRCPALALLAPVAHVLRSAQPLQCKRRAFRLAVDPLRWVAIFLFLLKITSGSRFPKGWPWRWYEVQQVTDREEMVGKIKLKVFGSVEGHTAISVTLLFLYSDLVSQKYLQERNISNPVTDFAEVCDMQGKKIFWD